MGIASVFLCKRVGAHTLMHLVSSCDIHHNIHYLSIRFTSSLRVKKLLSCCWIHWFCLILLPFLFLFGQFCSILQKSTKYIVVVGQILAINISLTALRIDHRAESDPTTIKRLSYCKNIPKQRKPFSQTYKNMHTVKHKF